MIEEIQHYTRNSVPMMEKIGKINGVIVTVSNAMLPGDVLITEEEYNAAVIAFKATNQANIDAANAAIEQYHANVASNRALATQKLVNLGLTEDEVGALTI